MPLGTVKAHRKTTFGKKTNEEISEFANLQSLTMSFFKNDFGGSGHSHA